MPDPLLQILKICLLAIIALFFLRVLRAVWTEIKPPVASAAGPPVPSRDTKKSAQPPGLRLSIVEPAAAKGQSFTLQDEMTVGRAAGCGVALADTTVSQLHARIFRSSDGRIWVEDLGSTNGTFVNRKKVSAPVPLRRGDRLQVGSTVLEVAR
jgi:pSer/pThr/pTyr-binding forkhead associated (FHA) protein